MADSSLKVFMWGQEIWALASTAEEAFELLSKHAPPGCLHKIKTEPPQVIDSAYAHVTYKTIPPIPKGRALKNTLKRVKDEIADLIMDMENEGVNDG